MSNPLNFSQEGKWGEFKNNFLKLLPKVSQSYDSITIFQDVCRIFSLSLRGTLTISQIEKDLIEKEYQTYVVKYGKSGMEKITELFAITVDALEMRRTDFLGRLYEALNATKKDFAQYLTPESLSKAMAKISFSQSKPKAGDIIKLNDPSCGAGALLIDSAEEFISNGGRQGDIILFGEDLDATACCIAYVQFSLLGYPGVITRQDSIAMKVYEGPWYTFGYFAHGIPMRSSGTHSNQVNRSSILEKEENTPVSDDGKEPTQAEINVRKLVQEEFDIG